ncbi:hypothetical protein STRTUCAR8_02341 [Streptomyces turgidiscabies Car8]|uniref:Uncharacterized protein n=1 Tax=Streptomyces turgidiscabies (strain Car8) TaxID=698760 RepID=L7FGR4_STRT8|nr:hypothetical protein STRTUCAR8_02341 [Streptomyces turgidiscabies Car8]
MRRGAWRRGSRNLTPCQTHRAYALTCSPRHRSRGAPGPRCRAVSPAPGAPCATRVSPAVPSVAPVPSVTGGSVGGGGVAGRGGMEARRASVLMHPPFPRTGAGPAESVRRGTRPSRARIPARAYRHPGAYLRARWLLPA